METGPSPVFQLESDEPSPTFVARKACTSDLQLQSPEMQRHSSVRQKCRFSTGLGVQIIHVYCPRITHVSGSTLWEKNPGF